MKTGKIGMLSILALSVFILTGCGNSSQQGSTVDADAQKHVEKPAKTVKPKKHIQHENVAPKKVIALWDREKDVQLKNFIDQWAPTMHQSYTKYDGANSLKTSTGTMYPDDLTRVTVNGSKVSIGWSKDGSGSKEYNVVAIYNHDGVVPPTPNHITYFFAFHDKKPVVLVDQSRDGDPRLTETENADVKTNFAKISTNEAPAKPATPPAKKIENNIIRDPKMVGIMVREEVQPDTDVTTEPNLTIDLGGDQNTIGERTVISTLRYKIVGDNVHYWTIDPNYQSIATAKYFEHVLSLKELQQKHYGNESQKRIMQLALNHATVEHS